MLIPPGRSSRKGSVYLLVLMILISSLSLVTGVQHVLVKRTLELEETLARQKLRSALLLGLEESIRLLADDEDLTVDHPSEAWAEPRRYTAAEDVQLTLQIRDAQSYFNLNHLSLPVSAEMPRTWMEILETLTRIYAVEVEPQTFRLLQQVVEEQEVWFESPEHLQDLLPEGSGLFRVVDSLAAVPRPANRPQPLNINTVRPEVLRALVGDSLQPWVDTVLSTRENRPIRNLGNVLIGIPGPVQPLLLSVLDVRSEYFRVELRADFDRYSQQMQALVKRNGGNVEVLRCRW